MEFGLFSESGNREHAVAAQTYQEDLDEIVLADQLGFEEAWIAEPNRVRPNTVTHAHLLMCKAAGLTKRIRFGTGIRQLPLHHPVDVVQEANMCDQVTCGRYMFGYGGTHLISREQMDMRGIDGDTRAMVYESVELILKCWSEPEPFDFDGRFWRGKNIHVLPRPYQQPHPPIAAACTGSPETIKLAAGHGFMPLFGRGNDQPEEVRHWSEIYLAAASSAGKTTGRRDYRVARMIYVADTDDQAKAEVREGLTAKLRSIDPQHLQKRIPPGGTVDDITFDYMVDTGFFWVGSPDTVYQQAKDFYDRCGGFGMLLLFAAQPMASPAKVASSMRLFMDKVAPRLAGLTPE